MPGNIGFRVLATFHVRPLVRCNGVGGFRRVWGTGFKCLGGCCNARVACLWLRRSILCEKQNDDS